MCQSPYRSQVYRYREQAKAYRDLRCNHHLTKNLNPVGASLLAKRPAHSTSSLTERTPSRASSLPQGNGVYLANASPPPSR
ncbi:hypothetical protein EMIT0347P_10452 [Pseudomonas sp. IT-347P]